MRKNVYKMRIDGTQVTQLTFGDPVWCASPVWSPDGRQIAIIGDPGGRPRFGSSKQMGPRRTRWKKTDASDTNQNLAWSPSREVIYQQKGLHNLRRVDLATQKESTVLAKDSEGRLPSAPVLSADGKNIAILWNREPREGIWVISLPAGSERLTYPGLYTPFGWSPDGHSIYAISEKSLQRQILRIDLKDSKAVTVLTTDASLQQ